jgi:hypothetical protein
MLSNLLRKTARAVETRVGRGSGRDFYKTGRSGRIKIFCLPFFANIIIFYQFGATFIEAVAEAIYKRKACCDVFYHMT